jgi:hypothetical protein
MERKKHLYVKIWQRELDYIQAIVAIGAESGKPLPGERFRKAGNRKRYAFKLEIKMGKVINNITGSAVARDLADVLLPSLFQRKDLRTKHFVVRMGKDFYLQVIPYRLGKPVQWADH